MSRFRLIPLKRLYLFVITGIGIFAFTLLIFTGSCDNISKNEINDGNHNYDSDSSLIVARQTRSDKTRLFADISNKVKSSLTIPDQEVIEIDTTQRLQRIRGFGASVTGSSAYVIMNYLNESQRTNLLMDLFNPETGIGISYIRMTIGASDFSTHNYSYNDLPSGVIEDPNLEYFSVEEDEDDVIPVLQSIFNINPLIELMGSPWSPPAWMKTTNSMVGGSLRKECFETYAMYFVKYIQSYGERGIPVAAITVQNEPEYEAPYPGMLMSAEEQADFIKNYLGPQFEQSGIDSKIVVFDHNWDNPGYPIQVLNDPEAGKYVSGSAFHCYAGDIESMNQVHDAFPDKEVYFTECSGGGWSPDFGNNLMWMARNLMIGAPARWATSVLLWNLALDENSGPTNHGCLDCRGVVTVNSTTGAITKNEEYYVLAHASKYLQPGAVRIYSSKLNLAGIENIVYQNPDRSLVILLLNDSSSPRMISFEAGSKYVSIPADEGSLTTLYIKSAFLTEK